MKKILFLLSTVLIICSCEAPKNDNNTNNYVPTTYTYRVVDKSQEVDSHYNFFTGKQVTKTVCRLRAKDEKGKIVKIDDDDLYYKYNIGDTFTTNIKYW